MKAKTVFWTISGIATVVVGYLVYKKITAPIITFGEVDSNLKIPVRNVKPNNENEQFPLKRGSIGINVIKLQKFLISEGYRLGNFGENNDGVDGVFGQLTESAVKSNQQPFEVFQSMYPKAIRGMVSKEFFDVNIRNQF